jgi:hypothetical protein
MTVSPHPKDAAGTALSTKVTALTTVSSALAVGPAKVFATDELRRTNTELVVHYMAIGRLDPAGILSTMT